MIEIRNELNEILLSGVVGDGWGEDPITHLAVEKALKAFNGSPVTVRINSPGGAADEGIGIYNAMKSYSGEITTINDSLAASAASVIFLGGSKRLMSQGSREALRHLPLDYTTDAGHFYRLPDFQALPAPGIVWSAGTAWRRGLSKFIGDVRQWQTKQAATLRLGLHPVDMRHDFSRRYWLQLLQQLLEDGRQPMTKFGWLQDQGFCLPGSSSRTSTAGCKLSHSSAAPSNSVPFSGVRASGS